MLCLNNYPDPARLEFPHQSIGDLHRQALLDLQTPRKHVDDSRHFGQTNDFSVWNISDVGFPNEPQQMVLPHRVEFDVLYQNDLTRFGLEQGVVDQFIEALAISGGKKLKRASRPSRRP